MVLNIDLQQHLLKSFKDLKKGRGTKYNYSKKFDRPQFDGVAEQPEHDRLGGVKKDASGNYIYKDLPIQNAVANMEFIRKNNLNTASLPHQWFDAFMSRHSTPGSKCSLHDWTTFTNMKAILGNAGEGGFIYRDFKRFTVDEIQKHSGVYILNGVSPSLQVSMKFTSHSEDPINGNDMVYNSFGKKCLALIW